VGHGSRDEVEALRLFRLAVEGGEERAQPEVDKLEMAVDPQVSQPVAVTRRKSFRGGSARGSHRETVRCNSSDTRRLPHVKCPMLREIRPYSATVQLWKSVTLRPKPRGTDSVCG